MAETRIAPARRLLLLAIAAAGIWAFVSLGLSPASLLPGADELTSLGRFAAHALTPALRYEGEYVPDDAPPILVKALDGARRTVVYAAAAMSLAIPVGLLLAFAASTAWWRGGTPGTGRAGPPGSNVVCWTIYAAARSLIAFMRSIHELLWAVLFLAAIGLSNATAVIAIAIPYAGTLAKVFSEMIDEAPRDAADALRTAGAAPAAVYGVGLVARAVPDMAAYTLYRFECALRSSAILGFFGPETLGKFIKQSWDENHYGEVWTYLFTLFALIALVDWWSGAMRRRFAA